MQFNAIKLYNSMQLKGLRIKTREREIKFFNVYAGILIAF